MNLAKKKIVIITGNSLRHKYIQNIILNSSKFKVSLIIQEIHKKKNKKNHSSKSKESHFKLRDYYEKVYFKNYSKINLKKGKIISIKPNTINKNDRILKILRNLKPDIILCFGCSVLGSKYLKVFSNKILNIHLGLSPFYRGQATNYWAFVNNEIQFIGATFHKIDGGIDTGPIIHQIRPKVYLKDNVHTIGNRVIKDLKKDLVKILLNFEKLKSFKKKNNKSKYFKSIDFTEKSLNQLHQNYKDKIISSFLKRKKLLLNKYPIIINKYL